VVVVAVRCGDCQGGGIWRLGGSRFRGWSPRCGRGRVEVQRSQELVLLLQKFDAPRKFVVARRGDQGQQRVPDFGGPVIVATRYSGRV